MSSRLLNPAPFPEYAGPIRYVDPTNGSDTFWKGRSPSRARRTIAQAQQDIGDYGVIALLPGQHSIGTASSSATGLSVGSYQQIVPAVAGSVGKGGFTAESVRLYYLGTGTAIETLTGTDGLWSGRLEGFTLATPGQTGAVGLHVQNPQNSAVIRDINVGANANWRPGASGTKWNFTQYAMNVDWVDTGVSAQSMGSSIFERLWLNGGAVPLRTETPYTNLVWRDLYIDGDNLTTKGIQIVPNNIAVPVNPRNGLLTFESGKMELHYSEGTAGSAGTGSTIDPYGFSIEADTNALIIGYCVHNDSIGTHAAYYYSPAPTGGLPRVDIIRSQSYQMPYWWDAPNLPSPQRVTVPSGGGAPAFNYTYLGFGQSHQRKWMPVGTTHGSGNVVLTGWGTGAATGGSGRTGTTGNDARGTYTIVAGTAPSANPTVKVNMSDGGTAANPVVMVRRGDLNTPTGEPIVTARDLTSFTVTFPFTPTAGTAYTFDFHLLG